MTINESKVANLQSSAKTAKSAQYECPETPRRSSRRVVPPSMPKTVTIWEEEEGAETPTRKSQKSRAVAGIMQEKTDALSASAPTPKCRPVNRRILREVRGLAVGRPRQMSALSHPEKTEEIKPIRWQQLFKTQLDTKRKAEPSKTADTEDPFA